MPGYRVRYHTIEVGNIDIHLRTLRDTQEYFDDKDVAKNLGITSSSWSLFGVVWESSQVLANVMSDFDFGKKRILEVGCGIGLASLLLNKRGANITATDYHPEAELFLARNIQLNNDASIPFVRAGWADKTNALGKFDIIIGSDILYEPNHAELLSQFIDRHSDLHSDVILVDPGRISRGRFNTAMEAFGYDFTAVKPDTEAYLPKPYLGKVLRYSR